MTYNKTPEPTQTGSPTIISDDHPTVTIVDEWADLAWPIIPVSTPSRTEFQLNGVTVDIPKLEVKDEGV